jgi:hypothetical protein
MKNGGAQAISTRTTGWPNLRGGGESLKQQIWDAAKDTIEQWTGMELQPTSMYGIRVYTEGKSSPQNYFHTKVLDSPSLTFLSLF